LPEAISNQAFFLGADDDGEEQNLKQATKLGADFVNASKDDVIAVVCNKLIDNLCGYLEDL